MMKQMIRAILETYLKVINNFLDFIGFIFNTEMPNLELRKWIDERL